MKLKIDDICVESFDTAAVVLDSRGTVEAHASQLIVITCRATCPGQETCPECPVL
jgi:hypothetical protein